jgi:GntR family transcriptional regulator
MIVIDKFSRKPIYEQIIEGIERQIVSGVIKELDQLPSIRELSVTLSINPNTIQKAFVELDRSGIIFSNQGRGCFVSENAKVRIKESMSSKIEEFSSLARELHLFGIEEDTLIDSVKKACNDNK